MKAAGARIRTWELLREQILSLPPLAARPPRPRVREERSSFNRLPMALRSPSPRPPPRSRRPRALPRRAAPHPPETQARATGAAVRRARASGAPARTVDRCAPYALPGGGSAPSGPRPSTPNNPDSRAPGTPEGCGRCTGCPPDGRGSRTGPRGPCALLSPRARRERKARRSVPGRSGSSPRSDVRDALHASRGLRLLTYRTEDRGSGDDRSAADAVLAGRRRRYGRCRSRRRSGHGVGSRRRHTSRYGRQRNGRDRRPGGSRGRRKRGRAVDLRQGESTLGTEQGPVRIDLPAVKTHRHVGGKVNAVFHGRVEC